MVRIYHRQTVEKECVVCKKIFMGTTKQKTCSSKCHHVNFRNVANKYYKKWREKHHQKYIQYQQRLRITIKKKHVLKKGGRCENCGYDKNLAVLTFHHNKKLGKSDYNRRGSDYAKTNSFDMSDVKLLCSNCHLELHNLHLNNWNEIILVE